VVLVLVGAATAAAIPVVAARLAPHSLPSPTAALPPGAPAPDQPPQPVGQGGGWQLIFGDDFDGTALDTTKWTDRSSAESDAGRGNQHNHQLEWNQAANCVVSDRKLAMIAKREAFAAPSGTRYSWTSCLLSTTPSVAFQYGYLEERAILPWQPGFWPAFWTWQAPDVHAYIETDVYELHTANPGRLLFTQHSGDEGGCQWRPGFNPATGWHTYAADIEPSGTVWYVDGAEVCRTAATSTGATNIISNLAVDGNNPPEPSTGTAVKLVDYIRAWRRG
jgi:beta-glucanase (GH16 family)